MRTSRGQETVQLDLTLEEVQTLLTSLSEENTPPSLKRFVQSLQMRLELAERKLVAS
jgi:hypothetical protein